MTTEEWKKEIAEAILDDKPDALEKILAVIPPDEARRVMDTKFRFQKTGDSRQNWKVILVPSMPAQVETDTMDLSLTGLCQLLGREQCAALLLKWQEGSSGFVKTQD